jgi:phage shock protein A
MKIKSLNENIVKLRHEATKLKAEKDALKHELDENIAKREGDEHTISEYRVKIKLLREKENEYIQDQETLTHNHNSELAKLKENFENSTKDASHNDKDKLIESKFTEINDIKNKLSKIRSEYEELRTTYKNVLEEKASLENLYKEKETSLDNEIVNHEKTKHDIIILKQKAKNLRTKSQNLNSNFHK